MTNVAKTKAKEFIKKYKFTKPDIKKLYGIIESQGFVIIEYNGISDEKDVENVITSLKLTEYVKYTKAFTYVNEALRLVFVHEDLSDDEKLEVLLHEEGHIFCDHLVSGSVFGSDIKQEKEANEFVHYVTNQSVLSRIADTKVPVICTSVIALVAAGGIWAGVSMNNHEPSSQSEEDDEVVYYVTSTGTKYHVKDCGFVKYKTNTRVLTTKEYNNKIYEPCEVCIEE